MKISINVKWEAFASWVEMGLQFIGSGSYCRDGNKFILNINPMHYGLLCNCLSGWAKGFNADRKELGMPKLRRGQLYAVVSE